MILRSLVLVVLACAMMVRMPDIAYGAEFSGSYILHVCGKDFLGGERVAGGHTACQAYIAGIVDYHNLVRSLGTAPSVDFCIPNDVDVAGLQDVILAYFKKNAENHNEFSAAPGVALALFEAYPCR